jgi:Ca2+-binding EF-hand superfamily protein
MFEELDTNQDGYASYQEYKALMSQNPEYMEDLEKESKEQGITKEEMMQKDFDLIDRNGDKRITKKEIKQGIRDDL